MSRLLDALRNLQQTAEPPARPSTEKVTPRLAASIRRAVLGKEADVPSGLPVQTPVLFRVQETLPPVKSAPVRLPAPAAEVASPLVRTPDPLSLVDAISASLAEAAADVVPSPPQHIAPPPTVTAPAPRPIATPGEQEIFAVLADVARSAPYRNLLQAAERDTRQVVHPLIAVLGIDDRDATAFVAAALATLLAEERTREVLLVEANLARSLAERYHVSRQAGLCEWMAGRSAIGEVIRARSHERLQLLPYGQATAGQAQLLPSSFPAELSQLRSKFGTTVIDAGALTSPWGVAASQAADAVYLLVRLGDTAADHATRSVNRFRAAGGKLTGCVAIGGLEK